MPFSMVTMRGKTPYFLASENASITSATSITINKPTGVLAGDLMVAVMGQGTGANSNITSGPSGWSEEVVSVQNLESAQNYCEIWTKVATDSEGASYTWNYSGTTSTGKGVILAFRNSPIAGNNASAGQTTESSTHAGPAVTMAKGAGGILVCGYWLNRTGVNSLGTISSGPSGMTQDYFNSTGDRGLAVYYERVTGGSTGTKTLTMTNTDVRSAMASIEVRPH